jgi:hypothetical protein
LFDTYQFEDLLKKGLFFQQHTVSEEKLAENPGYVAGNSSIVNS